MNEYRHKILDLKTDNRELLLNSLKKFIDKTVEVNDKEFEQSLNDLGRFVLAMISAKRIAFKVLHPHSESEEDESVKYEEVN